jgi:hypothetical protein
VDLLQAKPVAILSSELHVVVDDVHQLVILDGTKNEAKSLLLPFDDWFLLRVEAAIALWRSLRDGTTIEAWPATVQRRLRLILGLRALDGRADGASYRDLAKGLFDGKAVPAGVAWKTHDLRSRVMRLVGDAIALRDGGYRGLLFPRDHVR